MKYLLYSMLLLSSIPGSAQVIFSENFENFQQVTFPPPWKVEGNTGSFPWRPDIYYYIGSLCFPYVANDTKVAGISDIMNYGGPCAGEHNDSNVLLCTPYLNLSAVTNVWMQYDSWFSKQLTNGKYEQATVEISIDSGHNWTVLAAAPVSVGTGMRTAYIDLSAFAGQPAVRLGFRYSDQGEHMTGWMVDNLKVFAPLGKDLALTEATPSDTMQNYRQPQAPVTLSGTVFNNGLQPISSYTVNYRAGSGPVQSQIVNGISLQPFQSQTFQLPAPFTVPAIGRYDLKMWVSIPGDMAPANDSGQILVHGVSFLPVKQVVVEHSTGTWYPFAPQAYELMRLLTTTDFPVAPVALHDQDPMFLDTAYTKYVEHMANTYSPVFFYDRRNKVEVSVIASLPYTLGPAGGVYSIFDPATIMGQFERMRQYFGFATINLRPSYSGNTLQVDVDLIPATPLQGVHRLALVLAEDQVKGADTGYRQLNGYAGNALGAMGGYEFLPFQVPAGSMSYDYVGRRAVPHADGAPGSLPLAMAANGHYAYSFQTTLPPSWIRKNLKAHVLLIRDADSTILNSSSVSLRVLGIRETANLAAFADVYPNPADQSVNLLLQLRTDAPVTITATDITGRTVWQSDRGRLSRGDYNIPLRTDGWASGMYLLRVQAGESRQTLKVDVIH